MRRAPAETARLRALHDAGASSEQIAAAFDKRIYGSKAVKRHLKAAQHGKCCYCESLVEAVSAGDVEHYRPKGRIEDVPGADAGYYWLIYDWDNLFFACCVCNESFKRSRFPLVVEADRASSQHDDLTREDPLILDPSGPRDPRRHIAFRRDVPRGLTEAGRRTVEVAGLDREALNAARRKHIRLVRYALRVRDLLAGTGDPAELAEWREAVDVLDEFCRPSGEYWSVTQDLLVEHAATRRPGVA